MSACVNEKQCKSPLCTNDVEKLYISSDRYHLKLLYDSFRFLCGSVKVLRETVKLLHYAVKLLHNRVKLLGACYSPC